MAYLLTAALHDVAKRLSSPRGAKDSGFQLTLARVASKEEVLEARPLRKRVSTKEVFADEGAPSLKRVNSKEELSDIDLEVVTLSETASPRPISRSDKAKKTKQKSIVMPKLAGLEKAVFTEEKLERAIIAAKNAHCAEGLEFLKELRKWEVMKPGKGRATFQKKLQSTFLADKSPKELCLPTSLREKVTKGVRLEESDLMEIKRIILNDIRFNERVLEALM